MPDTEAPEVAEPSDKQTTAEPDPAKWEEAEAVTGRANDTPVDEPAPAPLGGNSTFAERAAARNKQQTQAESKAEEKKPAPKRTTRKKAS